MRKCPICSSSRYTLLNERKIQDYDNNACVKIVSCQECSMVYKDITYEKKEDKYDEFAMLAKSSGDKKYIEDRINYVSDYLAEKASILDVGCNSGDFLYRVKEYYPQTELMGIEISPYGCARAKEKGIPVIQTSIYDKLVNFHEKFDIITFSHVLEHLEDIKGALLNIKSWLKKDGIFYISVPADGCDKLKAGGNLSSFLCLDHLNHFDEYTIERALIDSGFIIIEENIIPYYQKYDENKGDNQAEIYCYEILCKVYSEDTPNVVRRTMDTYENKKCKVVEKFNSQIGDNPYTIWGKSNMAKDLLKMLPSKQMKFWVDMDKTKWKEEGEELAVYSPEVLKQQSISIVLVDNFYLSSILETIEEMGLTNKVVVL